MIDGSNCVKSAIYAPAGSTGWLHWFRRLKYNHPLLFFALAIQGVAILTVATLLWMWQGWEWGTAALYGGAVSFANSGLLAWRWWRGRNDYSSDASHHLKVFYYSMVERLLVVAVFLAVGLHVLKLTPTPLFIGFIAGLLVWMTVLAARKTK